jgi:transcriptional regulator with XRE-family HTH domain
MGSFECSVPDDKVSPMPETNAHAKLAEPVDIALGDRIKQRRKLIGMSQTTLAEKIGVTFQQVQKYEKGMNRVGSSRLVGIASALGLTPSALFGESETAGAEETADVAMLSSFAGSTEGLALNHAFLRIDDGASRKAVIALVRAIASVHDEEMAALLAPDEDDLPVA